LTKARQAAAGPAAVAGRPRYQYWLLPFAAGVAIALVLALWLFPRGDVLAAPGGADRLEADYLAMQDDEKLLRAEVARLAALIAGQRRDCKPPGPPVLEGRRPPVEEKPPVEETPPVRREPPVEERKPDEDLSIPEDAKRSGDMSFLEGCWTTITGLVNVRTREPIVYEYCFDKNGQGTASVTERSGRRCVAPTTARVDETGKLIIEDQSVLRCPQGDHYVSTRVQCESSSGGTAQCSAIQSNNTRWQATMKRKGAPDLEPAAPPTARVRPGVSPTGRPGPGGIGPAVGPGAGPGVGPGTGPGSRVPPADNAPPADDAPPSDDQPPMDDQPPPDNATPPPSDLPPVRGERTRPRR
jgi:hypothetical protein